MSPQGISRALSEDDSSNSLKFESNAEIGSENTLLPITYSQTFASEQDTYNNSTSKSQNLYEPVSDAAKLQSAFTLSNDGYLNRVMSYLDQCKINMSLPVKQRDPFSSNENTSDFKKDQIMTDHNNSIRVLELNAKEELISSFPPLPELNTEIEKPDCSSGGSKVVVQAMPIIDFGNITALQQCIGDRSISRESWSDFYVSASKTFANNKKRFLKSMELSTLRANSFKWAVSESSETQDPDDDFTPSIYSKKRKRKNHNLNFHIRPGRGTKLVNIEYIASALPKASLQVLRLVHYVMFGSYGVIKNDSLLEQTEQNILHFSGFTFNGLSEEYEKKFKSLMRLPYPLLLDIYDLLIQEGSVERTMMVRQLLQFCLKPTKGKLPPLRRSEVVYSDEVTEELKKAILNGPSPVVMLERSINESIAVKRLMGKDEIERSRPYHQGRCKKYVKPSYIVKGPGQKLKCFPNVVEGVHKARRRIINLLHIFLYGKPGSDELNRLNILEFNGFLQHDKNFLHRKIAILKKYKKEELEQLCNIFSLRVKSGNKMKIKKLLFYLQAPSLVTNCKRRATELQLQTERQTTQKLRTPANELLITPEPSVLRLRDFEKICLNIECAPPRDLAELNDLLFIKPFDVSDIHEKILNFTAFQFGENCLEFHYRKTLLHYMGFDIVKKIACILDIPLWENSQCQQELAIAILKFLMEMKRPDKTRKRMKYDPRQNKRKMKSSVSSQKPRPHILLVKKDPNFCYDREKTCETSSSGMINSMYTSNGFHEEHSGAEDATSSVVVKRISESSYSWTDFKNGPITISNLNSDESLSLHEFAHHPTENQLELTIKEIICSNSWSITIGDLLNKVLHHYPKFNLMYRSDFIKAKALEILQEMQECLVDSTLEAT